MKPLLLPATSWVPMTTRRLRTPHVLWQSPEASAAGFDPDQIYCCPKDYEAPESYGDETRQEGADRYGGIGVGTAAGSGRCSTFNGMQTKGVGVTPLVAPDADANHSSGTLMLVEAALEAVYGAVFNQCLPFGAVPVHALVWTGGRYARTFDHDAAAPCHRTLAFRPYVPRPAHFMRNVANAEGRLPAVSRAVGWTRDAWRTVEAMSCLALNLKTELNLEVPLEDEAACLDAGLRELAKRYAWQAAASFAKRLPHGTLSASNLALSGAYLDYGLSSFVDRYRRLSWPPLWQDPWTEPQLPIQVLASLRQQLDKYRPQMRGQPIAGVQDLTAVYERELTQRLGIEMARMAGLTEDLAQRLPVPAMERWLTVMREVWTRGAGERFVHYAGHVESGVPTPPPRKAGRYDLNAVFSQLWLDADAEIADRRLAPFLNDDHLRCRFVTAAFAVRQELQASLNLKSELLTRYLIRQAQRKNSSLAVIERDCFALHPAFTALEASGEVGRVGPTIEAMLAESRTVLSDGDPGLSAVTGMGQLRELAAEIY